MNDDKNSNELPRRRFVAFSGAIGAATLLTGAGAATGRTASAAAPTPAHPVPDTCPTPPPGGAPTCPLRSSSPSAAARPTTIRCGGTSSTARKARRCPPGSSRPIV